MGGDFLGARASGAGDEFHELWVVRQALELLRSDTQITSIEVEGVRASDSVGSSGAVWDGVDCCIYRQDTQAAETVEIQQLKYSPSAPEKFWTVSRLTSARDGDRSKTVLNKLARAYAELLHKNGGPSVTRIALVSNQPVAPKLLEAIRQTLEAKLPKAWSVKKKPAKGASDAQRLFWASGLQQAEFKAFLRLLAFDCGEHSRLSIDAEIISTIGKWTDAESIETANRLKSFARRCMLPEGVHTPISRELVLLQFGTSDPKGLFPCASKVKRVPDAIPRAAAKEIVTGLKAFQYLCLQGGAGTGKTTVLQQVQSELPTGSVMITFDCYGGGSYLDPSSYRHREEDAYRQIANEIAATLRLPLVLAPTTGRDHAKRFKARIEAAAQVLGSLNAEALLVLAIDAADNSFVAAHTHIPPERSFVEDLVRFEQLPPNVRIVVSARPGRIQELALPSRFLMVSIGGFTRDETRAFASRVTEPPDDWVDDFHKLTAGNPRLQTYALAGVTTGDDLLGVLDSLRPGGRVLDDLFREHFEEAIRKTGVQADIELVCAGLIALPRPIPLPALSQALRLTRDQVMEICMDLALTSGLRIADDLVGFADEDFEHFVRDKASVRLPEVTPKVADFLLATYGTSEYAVANLASTLYAANRRQELLRFALEPPPSEAIKRLDPVRRREVETQRLQLAIRVCREAEQPLDAVRYLVLGSEGVRTEAAIRQLIVEHPDLSVRFAGEAVSRLVLMDGTQVPKHGALLAHAAEASAQEGDFTSARNSERRLSAWFRNREHELRDKGDRGSHEWDVSPDDLAPIVTAKALEKGPGAAYAMLRRVRPGRFRLEVAMSAISRLLAFGHFQELKGLANLLPSRWRAIALVPLAIAGIEIDVGALERSLKYLASLHLEKRARHYGRGDSDRIREVFLSGCEVLAANAWDRDGLKTLLAPFVDVDVRRRDMLSRHDSAILEAVFRAYAVCSAVDAERFAPGGLLVEEPEDSNTKDGGQNRRIEEMHSIYENLYTSRANYLVAPTEANRGALERAAQRLSSESWRLSNDYELALLRRRLACSLTVLLVVRDSPSSLLQLLSTVHPHWLTDQSSESLLAYSRLAQTQAAQVQLFSDLATARKECEAERVGSKEKAATLAHIARLLAYISHDDGRAVFFRAIEISEELDVEIRDLLMLAEGMVRRADASTIDLESAANLAEVIRDALIRFRHDSEAVPLSESMAALAQLSFSHAMAAALRWHDDGIEHLEPMVSPIVGVGISDRRLSSGSALALLGLLRRPGTEVLEGLVSLASEEGAGALQLASEELARDVCLDRIEDSSLLPFVEPAPGSWGDQLLARRRMEKQASPREVDDLSHRDSFPESGSVSRAFSSWELTSATALGDALVDELAERRARNEWVHPDEIFSGVRGQVLPSQRAAHLGALLGLDDRFRSEQVVSAISAALDEWRVSSPAVEQWGKAHATEVVSDRLLGFFSYRQWEFPKALRQICCAGDLSDRETSECILQGVEKNATRLSASGLLQVAGWIVAVSTPADAASIAKWYLSKLANRINVSERESSNAEWLIATPSHVVASVLFRLMGDVDHRLRWKAAHATRRLARFSDTAALDVLSEYLTAQDIPCYRASDAPFYWLAARLWLTVALDRIAGESPRFVTKYAERLFAAATDPDLPHVLIRGFARDACEKLIRRGLWSPGSEIVDALDSVNRSPFPMVQGNRYRGRGPSKSTKERFSFDTMDTTRYWYESVVDMFDELSMTEFLDEVEGFIIDKWHAESSRRWDDRPRRARFESSTWSLHSNSHGSIPMIEPYHTHLEWHGMWCALGALLANRPLLQSEEEDYFAFAERVRRDKLTEAPFWLADLVTPKPLYPPYWLGPEQPIEVWLRDTAGVDFLSIILSGDGSIVVNGSSDARSSSFSESLHVSSALVCPRTSSSLLRALQSVEDAWEYYLPTEGHEEEISEGEFQLVGWLRHQNKDGRIDDTDSFSVGIGSVSVEPGIALIRKLDLLVRDEGPIVWVRRTDGRPVVRYEPWGRHDRKDGREEYLGSTVASSGHFLKISDDGLQEFLAAMEMDLIVEVRVERRDERSKRTYNEEEDGKAEVTFDRLFVLRQDGSIHTACGRVGAWRAFSS